MSKRKTRPFTSNAEVVLQLLDNMSDNNSKSDSDFDGYVDYDNDDSTCITVDQLVSSPVIFRATTTSCNTYGPCTSQGLLHQLLHIVSL